MFNEQATPSSLPPSKVHNPLSSILYGNAVNQTFWDKFYVDQMFKCFKTLLSLNSMEFMISVKKPILPPCSRIACSVAYALLFYMVCEILYN